MTKLFVATGALIAATLAQPASATTFPSLTTIYVGAGVAEFEGGANGTQSATAFSCSNVSGQSATLRVLVLSRIGTVVGNSTMALPHGENRTVATSDASFLVEDQQLNTGNVVQGTVNIESTQSAVFCSALIVDPSRVSANGVALHLVRVNPHPGTVE